MTAIGRAETSLTLALPELMEYPEKGILSKVLIKDSNCQYTLFCLAKDTEIEEHTSSRNATILVLEGKGQLTIEGREIILQPGVFVFMPAHTPHALQASDNLGFLLTLSEQSPHGQAGG